MDYRKFLAANTTSVLPYFGGPTVHAADRRLRVTTRVAVGWWTFDIQGRNATATTPAEPEPLDRLPSLRGHVVGSWLFVGGRHARRMLLMPEEEPPVLCPVTARVWPGDHVLFDVQEFEGEAEEAARAALLDAQNIAGLKGATPSLRRAFGYARLQRVAAARGLQVSVREVFDLLHGVADGVHDPVAVLDALEARVYQLDPGSLHRARTQPTPRGTIDDAPARAATALEGAGAVLLDTRVSGENTMDVTFRYRGEQFIAVVDAQSLHVYDAGICLDGADEELGLDALPSVISEAMDGGLLYITRRS